MYDYSAPKDLKIDTVISDALKKIDLSRDTYDDDQNAKMEMLDAAS